MIATASGAPSIVAHRWALAMMLGLSVLVSLAALRAAPPASLFQLGNLVGPTTQSLLHGGGLTACTEAMGTPGNPICFHAGRMPMASVTVALGIKALGYRSLRVGVFKTIVFLLPVQAAIWLVWRRLPRPRGRRLLTMALLLAPFAMTAFLADVVNLQVEEGYAYSLLALAVAILFFCDGSGYKLSWRRDMAFACSVAGLYLTKSSMLPAALVLAMSFIALQTGFKVRVAAVAIVLSAPLGWAFYQHHASGRYSTGTSLDGINLHKGNNPSFLDHYPPSHGETIDAQDAELDRGLRFSDEWSFNDFHQRAAAGYVWMHPRETLEGDLRKLWVIFFSVRKVGSFGSRGVMLIAETVGLIGFRMMLWSGILGAIWVTAWPARKQDRMAGIIFLALVTAVALPYVAGFAYTRHASVLIYPSALMCCRLLRSGEQDENAKNLEGVRK